MNRISGNLERNSLRPKRPPPRQPAQRPRGGGWGWQVAEKRNNNNAIQGHHGSPQAGQNPILPTQRLRRQGRPAQSQFFLHIVFGWLAGWPAAGWLAKIRLKIRM